MNRIKGRMTKFAATNDFEKNQKNLKIYLMKLIDLWKVKNKKLNN